MRGERKGESRRNGGESGLLIQFAAPLSSVLSVARVIGDDCGVDVPDRLELRFCSDTRRSEVGCDAGQ
jgi:hypothetical protein